MVVKLRLSLFVSFDNLLELINLLLLGVDHIFVQTHCIESLDSLTVLLLVLVSDGDVLVLILHILKEINFIINL